MAKSRMVLLEMHFLLWNHRRMHLQKNTGTFGQVYPRTNRLLREQKGCDLSWPERFPKGCGPVRVQLWFKMPEWVTGTEGGTWQDEHWVLFCMLANWTPIKNKFIIKKIKVFIYVQKKKKEKRKENAGPDIPSSSLDHSSGESEKWAPQTQRSPWEQQEGGRGLISACLFPTGPAGPCSSDPAATSPGVGQRDAGTVGGPRARVLWDSALLCIGSTEMPM